MRTIISCSILLSMISATLHCCSNINADTDVPVEKISVGPGPEDMVLDTLQGKKRLLISCSARREAHKPFGEILSFNLVSGEQAKLFRYNEPYGLSFHPHGIFLDRDILYVISHEKEPDDHPILIYRLHGDSLEFMEEVNSIHQHSPNALVTGPRGEIYFVNDSGKRGSLAEKIFKLKRASVVRLKKRTDGEWESRVVATGLGYPAGINRIENNLYVGDAIQNRIHVYKISDRELIPQRTLNDLTGNDNIRIHNGQLLVPGHVKPFKFIKHAKDPNKKSPVQVFLVDPESGDFTIIYSTDGSDISAGSTSIIFDSNLYISQVFDPFILKVPLGR